MEISMALDATQTHDNGRALLKDAIDAEAARVLSAALLLLRPRRHDPVFLPISGKIPTLHLMQTVHEHAAEALAVRTEQMSFRTSDNA